MNLARWFHDFKGVDGSPENIARRMLILAGPSGVGKTTLATLLADTCTAFRVVKNCTTRGRRVTDCADHFEYLKEDVFREKVTAREFFLCRIAPLPNYGYLKKDLDAILRDDKIAIFMFRLSGVDYLRGVAGKFPAVFIEAEPTAAAQHSRDKEAPPTAEDTEANLCANRKLRQELEAAGHPVIVVKNDYQDTLAKDVQAINDLCLKWRGDA